MTIVKSVSKVRKGGYLVNFYCAYCKSESTERKSHFDTEKQAQDYAQSMIR